MADRELLKLPAGSSATPERILHRSKRTGPKLRRVLAGWPTLPRETCLEWCPWKEKLSSTPRSQPDQAATWPPDACESRVAYAPQPPFPADAAGPAPWRGLRAHVWRLEFGPGWSWRR